MSVFKFTPPAHVVDYLRDNHKGDFLASLWDQYSKWGELSQKQIDCVQREIDKAYQAPKALNIPSADDLPSGRYAVENDEGELTFYRFWRGDRNPDFVTLHVQHGPDESEIPYGKVVETITQKILAYGPGAAAIRYGHEIRHCSRCGIRLTHAVSRALGIGPICGGHFYGEEFKSIVHGARTLLREAGIDPDAQVEDDQDIPRYDVEGDLVTSDIERSMGLTPTPGSDDGTQMMETWGRFGEAINPHATAQGNAPTGVSAAETLAYIKEACSDDDPMTYLADASSKELDRIIDAAQSILKERAAAQRIAERDTSFLGR